MRNLRPCGKADARLLDLDGDLRWWRLDVEPGHAASEPVAAAATSGGGWVANLQGESEAVAYAAAVAGRDAVDLQGGRGRTVSARLVGLDGDAAAALLDAASQAGLTVDLRRTGDAAGGGAAAILVQGAASWAALGLRSAASPADLTRLAHGLCAEVGTEPALLVPPANAAADRQRQSRGMRVLASPRLLASALAVLVAGAGAGGLLWSRAHTAARSPAAATTPPVGLDLPLRAPSTLPETPLPKAPSAKYGAAIAYDPARAEILMFGGVGGYSETWVWTPALRWILQSSRSAPQGRFGAAVAYNPDTGAIFLFGGRTGSGDLPADTWVWTGGWSPACLCGSVPGGPDVPPGGEFASMAFDATSHELVLVTWSADASQTWVWAPGGFWSPRPAAGAPPAPQAMAWDPVTHSLILVSQVSNRDGSPAGRSQTWSWNGRTWHRLADLPDAVVGVGVGGLALDPQTGHLVLVAARLTTPQEDARTNMHTWTWDGQVWTYAAPAPDGVVGIASDPVDHELLAFTQAGGELTQPVRDAYAWSGTFWVPLVEPVAPASAASRSSQRSSTSSMPTLRRR